MEKESSAKKFISNTLIFFVGTILSKMVSFLLMPLYTTKVVAEQMGIFDTSITLETMICSFCYFEIWSGVLRFLYSKEESENKGGVIRTGWKIFAVSTVIFSVLCTAMCHIMNYEYTYLVLGYGIANALSNQLTFIARGLGLNKAFSISGIINTFVHLSLNVLLLTVFNADYSALYISYIVGVLAQVLFLEICIRKSKLLGTSKNKNPGLFNEMLKYSLPLCLNTVSYWLLTSFNRIVYNQVYGNQASGIFSIGSRFGSIIALATTCFTYAWQDLAFSNAGSSDEENSKLYTTACNKYQQFLTAATVMLLPVINLFFPVLVKGDYTQALTLVPSFIVVAVISGYTAFIGNVFYAMKKTTVVTSTTIIAALFNLAVCYPLIKLLGGNGTNIATILAFVVSISVRTAILKKKINFSIRIKNILISAIWIIATIFTYYFGNMFVQIVVLVVNAILVILQFKNDIIKIIMPGDN